MWHVETIMRNPILARVRSEALGLTDEERAELVHDLIASLDGSADANTEQEWDAEVSRRLDEIDSGTAKLIDRKELSQRLRERLNRS
ncbi:MAG: addiction module protein [Burkholderiaceae bacterium]|nr:addiction module protein [Burkholderiaceae bacterium]